MKLNFSRLMPLSLILAMLMALIPVTSVYAAPTITSVSPSLIINNTDTVISIKGTELNTGAPQVSLGNALPLLVLSQSATEITALVPANTAVGSYVVVVTVGTTVISCATACVTVSSPPPPLPTSTPASLPFARPQIVVRTSRAVGNVQTGKEFTLKVVVENTGQATAYNSQAVFTSADLVPVKTGGVAAFGSVAYDDEVDVSQVFFVTAELFGKNIIVIDMTVTYYDDKGATYTDKFTLSVPVSGGGSGSGVVYPTATPTGVKSSQLVISSYTADVDPLQPGEHFALKLTLQNAGNAKAQRITMIVGGGSSGGGGGTPQPDGVSGGGGDFANFAPVGASNVQSLGDLAAGAELQASQSLIVNVNTAPGAYPMRITFSYLNDKNEVINDEQVITLLVYSLPKVDVSFYRPPDPFMVGQPGMLPIQVVNLGKRLTVLGNIKVSASNGFIENGTSLVGSLDAGGYFTLDSMFTPEQSGTQTLDIMIEYVDDFNQSRTVATTLEIEVMEGFIEPTPDPTMNGGGGGGGEFVTDEETTLHKIFRFIKGLFGLDSAWPVWQAPGGGVESQFEETVPIAPAGKGG